eukprot:767058-Hanusia_phi.AAC.4
MQQRHRSARLFFASSLLLCLPIILILSRLSWGHDDDNIAVLKARTSALEYFKDLGYSNAEKCDGSLPMAEQSPVAIMEGLDGNVVREQLPPLGWISLNDGGVYRMKTPGTDQVTGGPHVQLFVDGNKFDMRELQAHIDYGGQTYKLDHFLLKTPAEHTINGVTFGMEQQFVHYPVSASSPYTSLVISVLFQEHPLISPEFIEKLYLAIPCMGEGKHCQRTLNFASMARTVLYQTASASRFHKLTYEYDPMDACKTPPCVFAGSAGDAIVQNFLEPSSRANFRSYFKYRGSETLPPCEEGVLWLVMHNAVPIQSDHLAAFQLALGDIARPLQPLNGRVVQEAFRCWHELAKL